MKSPSHNDTDNVLMWKYSHNIWEWAGSKPSVPAQVEPRLGMSSEMLEALALRYLTAIIDNP